MSASTFDFDSNSTMKCRYVYNGFFLLGEQHVTFNSGRFFKAHLAPESSVSVRILIVSTIKQPTDHQCMYFQVSGLVRLVKLDWPWLAIITDLTLFTIFDFSSWWSDFIYRLSGDSREGKCSISATIRSWATHHIMGSTRNHHTSWFPGSEGPKSI